jgi:predicted short-subunit dehydrogenase-like oxidoreductase (DUF2520 family)
VRQARRIVQDLGGELLVVRKLRKPLYHASGSFASPLLVAHLAAAEQVARAAGVPAASARKLLAPILHRTLDNYLRDGAAAAFSGPLMRGDIETIRRHLAELRSLPEARDIYLATARAALRHLPVRNRKDFAELLRRG